MYNLNLMANAIYFNKPAPYYIETDAVNTNLTKEPVYDSFVSSKKAEVPKRPELKTVKEDFRPVDYILDLLGIKEHNYLA